MTYKELLNLCNEKPGCIKTKRQMKADEAVKKALWEKRIDDLTSGRKAVSTRKKK